MDQPLPVVGADGRVASLAEEESTDVDSSVLNSYHQRCPSSVVLVVDSPSLCSALLDSPKGYVNLPTPERHVDESGSTRMLQSDVGPFPHQQPRNVQVAVLQSGHQGRPQELSAPLVDIISEQLADASPHPLGISINTSFAEEGGSIARGGG